MPHDLNGSEIKVGDTVFIPCVVKSITLSEEYCNATLETKHGMHPSGSKSSFTLNAKQVVLQIEPQPSMPPVVPDGEGVGGPVEVTASSSPE